MNWFEKTIVGVTFLVSLSLMVAATRTVRVLEPADCKVMEQCLRHEGRNVRVLNGIMVQVEQKLEVVMNCRLPNGTVTDITYDLGPVSQKESRAK